MSADAIPQLTNKQRKQLRGLAHDLQPLVRVGHAGISEGVIEATRRALHDHELIKVRLHEPEDKHGEAAKLAESCNATLCGMVGHTVILYRPNPDEPRIKI